ncbi:MAG TPA: RNA polymerase sigma factor [Rectinemataceae bacterium]|nr:RNA polymerase sigma factor [Rectinemataceae bacterium]
MGEVLLNLDRKIWGIAYSYSRNAEEAKDLSQNIRLRVLEKVWRFRGESSPETWVYRIAINLAKDYARAAMRRRHRETELDEELPQAPVDHDAVLSLRSALQRLSPRQRQLISLREFAGLPYKEIAVTLGISLGSVESGLFDARARLADLVRGHK